MEDLNVYSKIKQLKADWMMRCAMHQVSPVENGAVNVDLYALVRNSIHSGEIVAIKGCVAELEAAFGTLIDNVEKQLKE